MRAGQPLSWTPSRRATPRQTTSWGAAWSPSWLGRRSCAGTCAPSRIPCAAMRPPSHACRARHAAAACRVELFILQSFCTRVAHEILSLGHFSCVAKCSPSIACADRHAGVAVLMGRE